MMQLATYLINAFEVEIHSFKFVSFCNTCFVVQHPSSVVITNRPPVGVRIEYRIYRYEYYITTLIWGTIKEYMKVKNDHRS